MPDDNDSSTEPRTERLFTRAEVERHVERARKEGRARAAQSLDPDAAPHFPLTAHVGELDAATEQTEQIARAIEQGIARGLEALQPPKAKPPRPPLTIADIEAGAVQFDPGNLRVEDIDSLGLGETSRQIRLYWERFEAPAARPAAPNAPNAANNSKKDK